MKTAAILPASGLAIENIRSTIVTSAQPLERRTTAMHNYRDEELGRAVGRVWAEGRANLIDWEVRTALGTFVTEDRMTWRTPSDGWSAELRRSRNGNHWFMALFEDGVYRGRYDTGGWHAATDRKRVRQLRSYQLRLAA
jgi:hypothetical protein